MKKYLIAMFVALFAISGIACAQDAATSGAAESVTDGGTWGYIVAAVIAVINAVLAAFSTSKETWWYKLLSWLTVRFGK